jgi:hypothetical protein
MPMSPHYTLTDTHQRCSHYVAIVEAQKDVEIYQRGDLDCSDCLRDMADKHASIAEVFRQRLVDFGEGS